MRRLSFKLVMLGCVILLPTIAFCQPSLPAIDSLQIIPENPQPADFVRAEIEGTFPTSGWTIPINPTVTKSGTQIDIHIFSVSPSGFVLQVLTPFMLTADVGLLPAGNYQAIASLFVNGVFHDSLSTSFNVVPEPRTWQLLIIGFVSMWLVSRGKIKMCSLG